MSASAPIVSARAPIVSASADDDVSIAVADEAISSGEGISHCAVSSIDAISSADTSFSSVHADASCPFSEKENDADGTKASKKVIYFQLTNS